MKKGIISVLSALTGAAVGAGVIGKTMGEREQKAQSYSNKHLALFLMMNQWVKVKQEGKNLASYFERNEYKKIAIYGMSYVGETLIDELKDTDIKVAYGIDKNAGAIYADVDIVSIEDDLEDVDAVVVTAITFFDEIEEKLSVKMDCPIISLEDILYEV
ncbi:MAG: hypothetical protein NC313_03935 [Butyrivibrio sp.]|nr:hypothetical protein [Butyrivibrio sp.]